MKKVLLAVALCAVISACNNDNPTNNGNNSSTQTETQGVKDEELVQYFELSNTLTVYQALEKLKAASGVKTIGGKQLNVTSVSEVSRDEQAGTFTIEVKGVVDGKQFKKTAVLKGYALKPTDEAMAKRVVATWKSGMDYQKEFDFDTLYRVGNASKFTIDYLSKFIDLTSSAPDGSRRYTFTSEDLAKTTISDVKYTPVSSHDGNISFTVTYKGIKSNTGAGAPAVLFDKNLYYQNMVSPNPDAAKTFYMRGVYENIDVFFAGLLKYDNVKFLPRVMHAIKNDGSNNISLTLKLTANDGHETELAQFTQTIKGFKPLTDLSNELQLAGSTELGEYFGKKFRNTPNGDKLSQMPEPRLWIEKARKGIRRGGNLIELSSEEVNGARVWHPASGSGSNLDIYLASPRFEVIEARKDGIFLHLKLKLVSVNDTAVEGVVISMQVHLISTP